MAEKKPVLTFENIMRDLRTGNFAPIYILMGDESYYIDQISDYIQEHAMSPDQQAFDQMVLFGGDVNAAQVADLCMQYPMLSPRRVVIVKEAQGMRSFDKLEQYAQKPQLKTVLVICYKNGSINRRLKFVAAVERCGVVFESKKLKDWQLPGRIKTILASRKVGIDDKSASMIAENIGADLHRLMSELDKLVISLPHDDQRVTPEVVERNIGISKDFNAFELRDAVVNRDILKANRIIKYFDKNPKAGSLYSLLPLLFRYFQNLMIAFYAANRSSPKVLAEALDLKSEWGTQDYLKGLKNYSASKALHILQKMREVDAKSKGLNNPSTSAEDLMKELIFFILH